MQDIKNLSFLRINNWTISGLDLIGVEVLVRSMACSLLLCGMQAQEKLFYMRWFARIMSVSTLLLVVTMQVLVIITAHMKHRRSLRTLQLIKNTIWRLPAPKYAGCSVTDSDLHLNL